MALPPKGHPPYPSPAYLQAGASSWLLKKCALLGQAHAQSCLTTPPKDAFLVQTLVPPASCPGTGTHRHRATNQAGCSWKSYPPDLMS